MLCRKDSTFLHSVLYLQKSPEIVKNYKFDGLK